MPYGSILIVDDVESNIYVAKGLMLPYELKIDTAGSGFEAIEKIRDGSVYDVIFMDHMMPRMDGVEATKIIRDTGYGHPIVALTASAVAGQAKLFLENGFDDYITKPIDIRQLNTVLNKLVRDKQTPETLYEARSHTGTKSESPSDDDLLADDDMPTDDLSADDQPPVIDRQLVEAFLRDAGSAVRILDELSEANCYDNEENINTYVVTIHGIKNALANIGEMDLSDTALNLEAAGREKRIDIIEQETPSFLDSLRNCAETYAPQEKEFIEEADEDKGLLHEKLFIIKEACEDYNMNIAMGAIHELRLTAWSRSTEGVLEAVAKHMLHGDFEAAVAAVEQLLDEEA
jgi:CheY-like chemotaxis protein